MTTFRFFLGLGFLLASQLALAQSFLGCYRDQGDPTGTNGRDLNAAVFNDSRMSPARCIEACRAQGQPYAGVQYSSWCFCGSAYGRSGPANNCNMGCSGSPGEVCGGTWANSVYATGAAPAPQAAADLTGVWAGNDGGTYFLRQVGNVLWWYGRSNDGGASWTNVYHAQIQGTQIAGNWADVPQGRVQQSGNMVLAINNPNLLTATNRTGGFGGSQWTRQGAIGTAPAPYPAAGGGAIRVLAGTYGMNCRQPRGNRTDHIANSCNGRDACDYVVDVTQIGDPAYGCAKDYIAEWQCGSNPSVFRAAANPEAGYKSKISLSCAATPGAVPVASPAPTGRAFTAQQRMADTPAPAAAQPQQDPGRQLMQDAIRELFKPR